MPDLAQLQIRIETKGGKESTQQLHKLTIAGKESEATLRKLEQINKTLQQSYRQQTNTIRLLDSKLGALRNTTARVRVENERTEKSFFNFDRGVKNVSIGLIGLSAAYSAFMWAQRGVSSAFANARELERLNAMLRVSEGSIEAAAVQMAKLEELSTQMPETLADVSQAFILAKNLGIDPTERSMISFGNTAVAMGKNINQFTQAVADAMTLEFERLKEFGIRARNEGETIRFVFKGTETRVKNDSRAIIEYLTQLGETEFAGSMAEQMDTLSGKLSNLEDAWFKFTNEVAGFDWAKTGIDALTEALNESTAASKYADFAKQVYGEGLKSVTESQIPLLEKFIDKQQRFLEVNLASTDVWNSITGKTAKNIEVAQANIETAYARLSELQGTQFDTESARLQAEKTQQIESFMMGIEDINAKILKEEREKYNTVFAIKNVEEEIQRIKERGMEGTASVDSELRELEKLEKRRSELLIKRGQEAADARRKFEGFFDDGKSEEQRLEDKQAREMAILEQFRTDDIISHAEYLDKKSKLEAEHRRERIKGLTGQLGEARDFFSELAMINQGENQKLFEINKAFALADAIIKGKNAIQDAWADTEGGFNAKLIAATKVGVLTAANIASIQSTSFAGNFAEGGFVGGSSYSGDRVTANVNSGEAILNPMQQRNFMQIANGGGGSKGAMNVTINNNARGVEVTTREDNQGGLMIQIAERAAKRETARLADDIARGTGAVNASIEKKLLKRAGVRS